MIVSKKNYEKTIQESYKNGYDDGCVDGYKNCEKQLEGLLKIHRVRIENKLREELEIEFKNREDRAYSDGLRDGGLFNT